MAYHSKTGQKVRSPNVKSKILDVFLYLYVQCESVKRTTVGALNPNKENQKPSKIRTLKFGFGMDRTIENKRAVSPGHFICTFFFIQRTV